MDESRAYTGHSTGGGSTTGNERYLFAVKLMHRFREDFIDRAGVGERDESESAEIDVV